MRISPITSAVASLLVGCTTSAALDGGGPVDIGTSPPSHDAGLDVPVFPGDIVRCQQYGGGMFPSFDQSCTTGADCIAVNHELDCSGSVRAIGIRPGELARFHEDEAACESTIGSCGWPTRPVVTDSAEDAGMYPRFYTGWLCTKVACAAGRCYTYFTVPPPGVDAGPADLICGDSCTWTTPALDRRCVADSDCTVVSHMPACSYSTITGIRTTDVPRFMTAEDTCRTSATAACLVPSNLTTDTGEPIPDGSAASVHVRCAIVSGQRQCTSYLTSLPGP